MKAAVVTEVGNPPRCLDLPEPVADGPEHMVVEVLAAGLHARVRSQAAGSHYSSAGTLPLVPGIDGVGRTASGSLRYFVLPDDALGAMAELTVIDVRRSVELPAASDPLRIAGVMNPAMSSWLALRCRIDFRPGSRVLILGATGSAGRMALQIAKMLGAAHVVAAGRDPERLRRAAALGADATVRLNPDGAGDLAEAGREVDVVLDYLWGSPTAEAMRAIVPARVDDQRTLTWVQLGSVAGLEAPIPSAALRATRLQVVGSGQGSVGPRDIVAELPALADAIDGGGLEVDVRPWPLIDVEAAWTAAAEMSERIVIVP